MRSSGQYPSSLPVSKSLTRKFLTVFVLGAAITTISTALFSYYHAHKIRCDRAGAKMQRVAQNVSEKINLSLNGLVRSLTLVANSADIRQALVEQNKKYEGLPAPEAAALAREEYEIWKTTANTHAALARIENTPLSRTIKGFASGHPGIETAKVVDRGGMVVGAFGKLDSPYAGEEECWRQTPPGGGDRPIVYEPDLEQEASSVIVHVCVPVRSASSSEFQGRVHVEYNLGHILSQADDREILAFFIKQASERNLYVLRPRSLASSRPAAFHEKETKLLSPDSGCSYLTLESTNTKTIAGFARVNDSFASSPFVYAGGEWGVVTALPETEALALMNALFLQALGFSVAMLILISLLGLAFARRLLSPIRVLQQGVQEIGQGNLEHRLDIRSDDEIELLGFEFNRMAERMQRTQEQLQKRGKELEQRVNQLRRLQAQLMQSERMAATGELAAQIAHEINNPLGILKNYVGIAKLLMAEDDPNKENMKILDQEINRIAGIVRRLLKFAKPGMEDIQSVQINQVIEELLALLRGQLFRRKIEVEADLSENLPEVSVSTDQMRQVLLNLVKNAEDAMPEGGKLSIRSRYRKGQVEIEIADTGCGIPPEDIKNIFEPFYTTKGVKGTGLGLSVSYGIVKNYNGEIRVESEQGGGTTFTIQLPVVSDKVFQVIQTS